MIAATMRRSRGRGLNDEERALWASVTDAITPLPKRRRVRPAATPVDEKAAVKVPAPVRRAPEMAAAASRTLRTPPQPETPSALARKARRRIAKGQDAIDARLDLHGFTQAEAHAALAHFLHASARRGARLVLVITGKGSTNRGAREAGGVLRRQVPLWLALPDFRALVIGFESAHVAHGGDGAFYVRLRRSAP